MPPKLEDFLSDVEAAGLRHMAEKNQEWVYLLKLLSSLETLALRQAVEFTDSNKAWERKGYAHGIITCRMMIQQLYDTRIGRPDDSASKARGNTIEPSSFVRGIAIAPDDIDDTARWSH